MFAGCSAVVPRRRPLPDGRCRGSTSSAFGLVTVSGCAPYTRLSTYGDRAFPVAASRVWNKLPHHVTSAHSLPVFCSRLKTSAFFVTVRAGTAYRKIWRLDNHFFARIIRLTVQKFQLFWVIFCIIIFFIELWHMLHFASELKWSRKMRLLSVFCFSFEISIACWLLSRPNWRIVSKLTNDVVTYCTEAFNQKSKYAYRKILFYKKSTAYSLTLIGLNHAWPISRSRENEAYSP